jgi:hypothetical protein
MVVGNEIDRVENIPPKELFCNCSQPKAISKPIRHKQIRQPQHKKSHRSKCDIHNKE